MSLTADQINDLVILSQKNLGKYKWEDLSTDLQHHVALPNILRKKKVAFKSGTAIQWNIITDDSGAARDAGLFDRDQVNVVDVAIQASEGWSMHTTNWAMDHAEITMNLDPTRIVDLASERRAISLISLANLFEERWWNKPSGPTDTNKTLGLFYWVTYGGDSAAAGFTGGDPDGFPAGCGGILSTAQARWQNWSAGFTDVSKSDLISLAREAVVKTNFRAPVPVPSYSTGTSRAWYTTYNNLAELERLLEDQNQNLGNDLASKDGRTMLRNVPVEYVPYLDQNYATQRPFIGIDWGSFKPRFLRGWFMREHRAKISPTQRNVSVVHQDTWYQYICYNRRNQIYFQKKAA